MANIKYLEKDYKEILLGLTPEEVAEYYKQLNKKIVNCYPTVNSNWNTEELNSLLASVEDVTNVLKKNYTKASLDKTNLSSRYVELDSKYINEIDLAFTELNYSKLLNITLNIGLTISSIHYFLMSLYNNHIYLLEMKRIHEEELDKHEEASVYVEAINEFIKHQSKVIEYNISLFEERFSEIDVADLTDVPEAIVNAVAKYNGLYSKCSSIIEEYEEIKRNPFKQAILFDVEVTINNSSFYTEEDYEQVLESKTASAPKYNFEKFEVEPSGVVN